MWLEVCRKCLLKRGEDSVERGRQHIGRGTGEGK